MHLDSKNKIFLVWSQTTNVTVALFSMIEAFTFTLAYPSGGDSHVLHRNSSIRLVSFAFKNSSTYKLNFLTASKIFLLSRKTFSLLKFQNSIKKQLIKVVKNSIPIFLSRKEEFRFKLTSIHCRIVLTFQASNLQPYLLEKAKALATLPSLKMCKLLFMSAPQNKHPTLRILIRLLRISLVGRTSTRMRHK